jgi:hypothetical protein
MAKALEREIRKLLDKAVRKARILVEDGARKALTELGLEEAKRPDGLSPAQVDLRNRLRTHARSLGDAMQPDGSIKANRLVREISYEHWHRALFARFLAENSLLIDPDHKVAVSVSELEEIAKDESRDLVEIAADWAEPMLPQIFRKDDPVLALSLPPETKAGITAIVNGLPRAVFEADDSLGWVYQFWQADTKDTINRSEVKIGADELAAVTQLFTEDYMVLFLLENTLGAWWAGKALAADPKLAAQAESEEELRDKTSPPSYRWTYLRFVREPRDNEAHETASGPWRPAAGAFEGWPKAAKDITVLDPCMGSGHFLVFALPILVAFRRTEEGLDERRGVKAVLAENLYGLEIDPRCTQIAAFALALASWKCLGGPEPLPRLNLACSGLEIGLGKEEFLKLADKLADAEGWKGKPDLLGADRTPLGTRAAAAHRGELEAIYNLFGQAPHIGSLIDPSKTLERAFGPLFASGIDNLGIVVGRLLQAGEPTPEARESAVTAEGFARAAEILCRRYSLIPTNVPYLGKTKQSPILREYLSKQYPDAAVDLSAAFLLRLIELCGTGGATCAVSPIGWWLQTSYTSVREAIYSVASIRLGADLGRAAFSEMNWWAQVHVLTTFENKKNQPSVLLDASKGKWPEVKKVNVLQAPVNVIPGGVLENNPDKRLALPDLAGTPLLETLGASLQGVATADRPRFIEAFWEHHSISVNWTPIQSTVDATTDFSGKEGLLRWEQGKGELSRSEEARIQGLDAVGVIGIAISQMNAIPATISLGTLFDNNCAVFVPNQPDQLAAVWTWIISEDFLPAVRRIEKKVSVTNASFGKVPFDLGYWTTIAADKYRQGLPRPSSNDPTQWLFDGHPRGSADPNVALGSSANPRLVASHGVRPGIAGHPLQVALARLLGYRWPRQTGSSFMDCPAITEPDEVEKTGLVDADGIVPLSALAGEADAATRLRDLIRAVWGPDYGEGTIRDLLAAEEAKANDLQTWLADEYFDRHCRLFHQIPFIWQVWDGARNGFSALVNYHRLCGGNGAGRRLLEKLRDTYLGEWIAAQRRAVAAGAAGAEDRQVAAEHLRGELTKIIEGDPPYDIFVRWKPLHLLPIGWEPDIDDGVRLNIRPFLTAKPKNPGRKDACILRVTPSIKKLAGADRGAEPKRDREDFPWFWAEHHDVAKIDFAGGPEFKGRRHNDFHFTRAFKRRARTAKAGSARGRIS